jgi:hypothetical protein
MANNYIQQSRIIPKRSLLPGVTPTIPASGAGEFHTDGGWIATDLYNAEFFVNSADKKLFFRADDEIREILIAGSGTTSDNIYNTDGTLTDNRLVSTDGYKLEFDTITALTTNDASTHIGEKIVVKSNGQWGYEASTTSSGFYDPDDISITFDGTDLTLSGISGDYKFVTNDATDYTKSSDTFTPTFTANGLYYIYYDNNGNLQQSDQPNRDQQYELMNTTLPVAYMLYNSSAPTLVTFVGDYMKGRSSNSLWTKNFYDKPVEVLQGLQATDFILDGNGDLNSSAVFGLTESEVIFTDRKYNIPTRTTSDTWNVGYTTGTFATGIADNPYSVLTDNDLGVGTTGRLVYNNDGSPTTVVNNDFVWYFVAVTNDIKDVDRTLSIMGEEEYGTLNQANNNLDIEIATVQSKITIKQGFTIKYAVLWQTNNLYDNDVKARIINIVPILSEDSGGTPIQSIPDELINGSDIGDTLHNHDSLYQKLTDVLWETGSTGNFSVKAKNDSTIDATSDYSHAVGFNTKANGTYSHSEGNGSVAQASASHAEGQNTSAQGIASHAEGNGSIALGNYSHAEGNSCDANGDYSHAEGNSTLASGQYSHASGDRCQATGIYSYAQGLQCNATNDNAHAEGRQTLASGQYSHAEGNATDAVGASSHAEGTITLASGLYSHAEGVSTIASGTASHSEGNTTKAYGANSHAEGDNTLALGNQSHAEGNDCIAQGKHAHAEGNGSDAIGTASHAEGNGCIAQANYTHAEGNATLASGLYAHAEGFVTEATNQASHAEGSITLASGLYAHAEGVSTIATSVASHSEGGYTIANANYSHAQGSGTTASGLYSHAGGQATNAIGNGSHTGGQGTITNNVKAGGLASFNHQLRTDTSSFEQGAEGQASFILGGENSYAKSPNSGVIGGSGSTIGAGGTTSALNSVMVGCINRQESKPNSLYCETLRADSITDFVQDMVPTALANEDTNIGDLQYHQKFIATHTYLADRMAICVDGVITPGTHTLALYDDNLDQIAVTPATSFSVGVNPVAFTTPVRLEAGKEYWASFAIQSGGVATCRLFNLGISDVLCAKEISSGVLPDPLPTGNATTRRFMQFVYSESAY